MDATTVNNLSGLGALEIAARLSPGTANAITGAPSMGSPVDAEDVVELSPVGIALWRADARSRMRRARLSRIRDQIEGGTFLTPERIGDTAEKLLGILGGASGTKARAVPRWMEIAVAPGHESLNERLRRYHAAGGGTSTLRIARPHDAALPAKDG